MRLKSNRLLCKLLFCIPACKLIFYISVINYNERVIIKDGKFSKGWLWPAADFYILTFQKNGLVCFVPNKVFGCLNNLFEYETRKLLLNSKSEISKIVFFSNFNSWKCKCQHWDHLHHYNKTGVRGMIILLPSALNCSWFGLACCEYVCNDKLQQNSSCSNVTFDVLIPNWANQPFLVPSQE